MTNQKLKITKDPAERRTLKPGVILIKHLWKHLKLRKNCFTVLQQTREQTTNKNNKIVVGLYISLGIVSNIFFIGELKEISQKYFL